MEMPCPHPTKLNVEGRHFCHKVERVRPARLTRDMIQNLHDEDLVSELSGPMDRVPKSVANVQMHLETGKRFSLTDLTKPGEKCFNVFKIAFHSLVVRGARN